MRNRKELDYWRYERNGVDEIAVLKQAAADERLVVAVDTGIAARTDNGESSSEGLAAGV